MDVPKYEPVETASGERTRALTPLVTVIIPTHNRADLLARAVASVRAQRYANLEILVVDDASSDRTPELIRQIDDSRIRYVRHDANQGGGATRNTGIRLARGEFIAFLDDDDYWRPDKVERQLRRMGHYGVSICGFRLNENGAELPGNRVRSQTVEVTRRMLRKTVVGWGTSTLMLRAPIARETLFDPLLASGQDWDFLIRLVQKYRIVYLDEPLVVFDVGRHQRITTSAFHLPGSQMERRLQVLYKHRSFFGSFWTNYHVAGLMLYRVRQRRDALRRVVQTVQRCGLVPVVYGFCARFYQKTFGY